MLSLPCRLKSGPWSNCTGTTFDLWSNLFWGVANKLLSPVRVSLTEQRNRRLTSSSVRQQHGATLRGSREGFLTGTWVTWGDSHLSMAAQALCDSLHGVPRPQQPSTIPRSLGSLARTPDTSKLWLLPEPKPCKLVDLGVTGESLRGSVLIMR